MKETEQFESKRDVKEENFYSMSIMYILNSLAY